MESSKHQATYRQHLKASELIDGRGGSAFSDVQVFDFAFWRQIDARDFVAEGVLDVLLDDAFEFRADAEVVGSDSPDNAFNLTTWFRCHGGG